MFSGSTLNFQWSQQSVRTQKFAFLYIQQRPANNPKADDAKWIHNTEINFLYSRGQDHKGEINWNIRTAKAILCAEIYNAYTWSYF